MYKLKENQTLSKAVNEGFFSRLKKDIRKITDKKIQKLIQKGERNTAAFLKDFKKEVITTMEMIYDKVNYKS